MTQLSKEEIEKFILQFATKVVSDKNHTVVKYEYTKRTKRTNYNKLTGKWLRTGESLTTPANDETECKALGTELPGKEDISGNGHV